MLMMMLETPYRFEVTNTTVPVDSRPPTWNGVDTKRPNLLIWELKGKERSPPRGPPLPPWTPQSTATLIRTLHQSSIFSFARGHERHLFAGSIMFSILMTGTVPIYCTTYSVPTDCLPRFSRACHQPESKVAFPRSAQHFIRIQKLRLFFSHLHMV